METTSSSSPRSIHYRQGKESVDNTTPPQTPNNNPYPTTFVQADTSNFKQVVQLLTGGGSSSPATTSTSSSMIPPIKSTPQKKQGFKLYERRNSLKNGFLMNITTQKDHRASPNMGFSSPRELLSPSILDFPSLVLSPRTPPPPNLSTAGGCKSSLEETFSPNLLDREGRAVAEETFYLHLSPPRTDNAEAPQPPPQLLPLFPLTSPRASDDSHLLD